MDIDSHAHLASPLHMWDPRWKIAALSFLILAAANAKSASPLFIAFLAALLLVLLARLPLGFVANALKYPLFFVFLMLPVLILTARGGTVWRVGPLVFHQRGFALALRIATRAVTVMCIFLVMFNTARLHVTMHALQRMRMPSSLVQILLFTYRYIFLYLDDLHRLRHAARLRGFARVRGMRRLHILASMVVVLLIRGFEQSERVAAAMRLRGFDGTFRSDRVFRTEPSDITKAAVLVCLGLAILGLELR